MTRTRWMLWRVTFFWNGRHPDADLFRWYGVSIGKTFVGVVKRVRR